MRGIAIASCEAIHGPVSREVRNRRLSKPTRFKPFCFADHKVWELVRRICLCLLLLTPVFFTACGVFDHKEGWPIVTVGKRTLTADQLKREMKRLVTEVEFVPEDKAQLRRVLVERIVDQCLILEYGREKGIAVSEEEIESVVRQIQRDYEDADFREILLKRCIDFEEWKEGLSRQILMRKIIEKALESVPTPTAEEIKSYFDAHAQEFKRPAMVRVRQVVAHTKKEAQELAKRLSEGGNMEEIAASHSISPDAKSGGELGWIEQGEMEEAIDKVVFSLPVGRISPVVETPYGFHVFRVISKRAEGVHYLPEVASEIERRISSQRGEAFFSEWLKGLEERFPVSVNQELLEKMEWA